MKNFQDLWSVRSVAGRKEMFCASFLLPPTFSISIFDQKSKLENKNSFDSNIAPLSESPPAKLMKTSK
jgi:hypothetical protein